MTLRRAILPASLLVLAAGATLWLLLVPGERDVPSVISTPERRSTVSAPPVPITAATVPTDKRADRTNCFLRSLADGSGISGFRLELASQGAQRAVSIREAVTGPDGAFAFAQSETPRVPDGSRPWVLPAQGVDEVVARATLWAYRTIEVRGVVRSLNPQEPIDFRAMRLVLIPSGDGLSADDFARADSPGTEEWLEAHGLGPWPRLLGHPDAEGRFLVEVPQISGLSVVADAPGWRTASAPIKMVGDSQDMELVLRRGIVLSGVVSAVDGTAVPGARVVAYVTVTGDYADGGPGRIWALQPEGGITGTRDRRSGTSRTTLSQQATTDASGRFVLAIRAEGPVRICTYGEGYRPIDRELGHVSDDVRDLVFEAEAVGQSDVVKLLCQGEPLRGAQVIVSDQSGSVEQPSLSYRTDSEGCVSTDWFVAGKLYAIILMGTEVPQAARDPRFLRWGGEREVDVASLPRKRP